jgi:glutamate dehydrogenase (NAD(P)+)
MDDCAVEVDEIGPKLVAYLSDPRTGLDAVVVIDNVDAGVAIGGVRVDPHIDTTTVARLARAMTWKNISAGIPHGGAKAGIRADPALPVREKEQLLRSFARAMRDLRDYVPGPDIGTNEQCMGWVHDEIGRAVAKPRVLGGIPLDEIGATGFGLTVCAKALAEAGHLELAGLRVAIQGFGAVGTHAARFLQDLGAVIVAIADRSGTVINPTGIDAGAAIVHKQATGALHGLMGTDTRRPEAVFAVDCDVIVPAAQPDVITTANMAELKAKVVLPGANIGVSAEAERWLHSQGVLCIPDFVANAGGVIAAAVEYAGGGEATVFDAIGERITRTTRAMLAAIDRYGVAPREAAERVARERLAEAASYRGAYLAHAMRETMPI